MSFSVGIKHFNNVTETSRPFRVGKVSDIDPTRATDRQTDGWSHSIGSRMSVYRHESYSLFTPPRTDRCIENDLKSLREQIVKSDLIRPSRKGSHLWWTRPDRSGFVFDRSPDRQCSIGCEVLVLPSPVGKDIGCVGPSVFGPLSFSATGV